MSDQWTANVLRDVLAFTNRWELDSLEFVNQNFAKAIRINFSLEPYRLFRKLIIRLFNSTDKYGRQDLHCTALYEHQIKKMSLEQVKEVFGNPNIRFNSTYIAIDPDHINMDYFFHAFSRLMHLWEGKTLVIDMDPHLCFEQLRFFATLFNDSITMTAGNLAVIDRSYRYAFESNFAPFMYADINRCRQITIAIGLVPELVKSIVDWLHEKGDLTQMGGPCKELTWIFQFGNSQVALELTKVAYGLIEELNKQFLDSKNVLPYKFWMLNVFHCVTLPQVNFNKQTDEMLTFEENIFEVKRYKSGLEESAFHQDTVDIKVERSLISDDFSCSSTLTIGSDSSASETISDDETCV